jgi:hypothetical protein
MKFVSGMCVAGMLVIGGMVGCGTSETKSTANQQESQKERDMKEADKAAMVYIRELIELDSSKLEALLLKPYEFIEGGKTYPGISKEMKERYDLYRYDLKEEEKKSTIIMLYILIPLKKRQRSEDLRMIKVDEKDGKWKNYEWAWDANNSLESIVGSMKPTHVHKWGKRNEKITFTLHDFGISTHAARVIRYPSGRGEKTRTNWSTYIRKPIQRIHR